MHLAMDSAHAEAAVMLINAGADRTRVRFLRCSIAVSISILTSSPKVNMDNETPEEVPGVGGSEQKHAKQHVIDSCGKPR
jgi:26S proteasome non-ATPase regulatory subunit 10